MKYGIGEILKKGSELTGEEQTKFMHDNFNQGLGKMIEYALEPEFEWDLPPGEPPYKVNQYLDQESNLYSEVRRMYIFMKTSPQISSLKKELNFVQLLENVSPEDATFLIHAKEKTLPYGWTAEKIREVYPGLIYKDTVENGHPDFGKIPDAELGKPEEVIVDAAPLTLEQEQLIEATLQGAGGDPIVPLDTGFVAPTQQIVQVEEITPPLTKKQAAMAKARATRAANLAAKKSSTEKSG